MITIQLRFTNPLTDTDVITAVETINYWTANRAMTQGEKPSLEWSSNSDTVHITADFENGNCWRKHGKLSDDWLMTALDEKKRRGYDLKSMLTYGKFQPHTGYSFMPLQNALVEGIKVLDESTKAGFAW